MPPPSPICKHPYWNVKQSKASPPRVLAKHEENGRQTDKI